MDSAAAALSRRLVQDPCFDEVRADLIRLTGMNYYEGRNEDFAFRTARRMVALGIDDCGEYLKRLMSHDSAGERQALIQELTIGETYFFRFAEQFTALQERILPDIIARNEHERRLHIWSAGCSIGAEPYSLAILLQEHFADRLLGWDVAILGTDVNRLYLEKAREGRFSAWALRTMSEERRCVFFEESQGQYILKPPYRRGVSFRPHNLIHDPAPTASFSESRFDLILCRNVLIYFGPENETVLVERFASSLRQGGWLLPGPADPTDALARALMPVSLPGTIVFRRAEEAPAFDLAREYRPYTTPEVDISAMPAPAEAPPEPAPAAATAQRPVQADERAALRLLLDRGDSASAIALAEEALAPERCAIDPVLYYFYALALEQAHRYDEAEQALRRALFLDRGFSLAHYHLSLLSAARGDSALAARSLENARNSLRLRAPDETLAGAEDITVAEMREAIGLRIEMARRGAPQ